eukprot:3727195-Prymnesium_polylepis.1
MCIRDSSVPSRAMRVVCCKNGLPRNRPRPRTLRAHTRAARPQASSLWRRLCLCTTRRKRRGSSGGARSWPRRPPITSAPPSA